MDATTQSGGLLGKNSVTVKLLTVGFLVIVLLIPTSMIQSLVRERQQRQEGAVREITSSWATEQTVRGPVLIVPFRRTVRISKDKTQLTSHIAQFTPKTLDITGAVETEVRSRGIFKAILYTTTLTLTGEFDRPSLSGFNADVIDWENAKVSIDVSDMRGVKEALEIDWNGTKSAFTPGMIYGNEGGLTARTPLAPSSSAKIPFTMTVRLRGSNALSFAPIGKTTTAKLTSPWPHPSFRGFFLPDERKVTSNGFEAMWNILSYSRNVPDQWEGISGAINQSPFGVEFLFPVDHYSNAERSIKYAVMFVFLTFVVFFFIEFFNKKRMHPIQYLLVGAALTLFYLLLLSLSEHIPFFAAYSIATLGVIGLIVGYTHAVFGRARVTGIVTGLLAGLYTFLYTLLQMEDYALLIGSVSLFAILGIIMYVSRKIDWYTA